MASAGRILIMPKGDWSAETEYEMLDLVKHNGTSWLAKKESTGIEPTTENSEYWQNMFDTEAYFQMLDSKIEEKIKEYMEGGTEEDDIPPLDIET